VILDNLTAHQSDRVPLLLEAKGVHLLFLPPYSPDLSPIEPAFSKIKQFLRPAKAQPLEALMDAIPAALDSVAGAVTLGLITL
jgi:transposase